MRSYKNDILTTLRKVNDNAITLKANKEQQITNAEKSYKGAYLENMKKSIQESYTSDLYKLTNSAREYLNATNKAMRKEVSDIATRTLSDSEISDIEFIQAYGIKKLQDNPVLLNMYLDKHAQSYPFKSLLASEGINLDNVAIPINEMDNLFSSCEHYLTNIETNTGYAETLESALLLSDNNGALAINGEAIDSFTSAYNGEGASNE